jgi:hypothetical protein
MMSNIRRPWVCRLTLLLIGAGAIPLYGQVVDADRSSPGLVSGYATTGDNALTVALYRKAGDDFSLAAMVEVKGGIYFNSKGIVRGVDALTRLRLAEAEDTWIPITKREVVDGRAFVTTEDGKTYTIFNLGISAFAGQIEVGGASSGSASQTAHTGDENIMQAQDALAALGYDPGPVDGISGSRTRTALKDYQRDQGLDQTGRLDEATAQALGVEPSVRGGIEEFEGSIAAIESPVGLATEPCPEKSSSGQTMFKLGTEPATRIVSITLSEYANRRFFADWSAALTWGLVTTHVYEEPGYAPHRVEKLNTECIGWRVKLSARGRGEGDLVLKSSEGSYRYHVEDNERWFEIVSLDRSEQGSDR